MTSFWRLALILVALTVHSAIAQPAGAVICRGLNHQAYSASVIGYAFPVLVTPAIRYSPDTNLTIDRMEIYCKIYAFQHWVEVYPADPNTGLPGTVPLVTGIIAAHWNTSSTTDIWTGHTFSPPLTLTAGTTYWFVLRPWGVFGLHQFGDASAEPDQTAYLHWGANSPISPILTDVRFMLRFWATSCQPSPPPPTASVTVVGAPCPATTTPFLLHYGLPYLGNSTFSICVYGAIPMASSWLFWSPAPDPVGIALGSGCTLYLDLPGLLQATASGTNPVATSAISANGVAAFPIAIPAAPGLAGFSFAAQAAIQDPLGFPTSVPGLSLAVTDALTCQIGN